jgi:hypothetical protein
VTAAADDRTFVLDEQLWVGNGKPGQSQFAEPRTFYLLRLDSAGGVASMRRLDAVAEPTGAMVTGLALSPDGKQLAVAVQPDNWANDPGIQQVRLYNLGTGTERTWSGDGTIGTAAEDSRSISWTADGRTLAIDWYGSGPEDGVRLLRVDAAGTSLLADSRLATLDLQAELVRRCLVILEGRTWAISSSGCCIPARWERRWGAASPQAGFRSCGHRKVAAPPLLSARPRPA